MHTED